LGNFGRYANHSQSSVITTGRSNRKAKGRGYRNVVPEILGQVKISSRGILVTLPKLLSSAKSTVIKVVVG
jgi:hypothetical protein